MSRMRRLAPALRLAGLLALVVVIAVPASSAEKTPDYGKLEKQFKEAHERGDYEAALAVAEQMADYTYPLHVNAYYNVAAMHCRLGHTEDAYEWVKFMLDAGFGDYSKLLKDEDFSAISGETRFKKLLRKERLDAYIYMLERPARDDFQKPQEVMTALAVKPGEKVADVGAGAGYFTIPIAKAVGPEGVVWAIDIRQELLDHIGGRVKEEKLENVRLQLVDPDDPQLPSGKVNTILMVDTWHYIRNPEYAKKLRAGLAPGGRVVVIDYIPKPWEERPWGPPPQQHTPIEEISAHFAEAGLKLVKSHDFLPEQYFLEYAAE